MAASATSELKVLINILSQGTALPSLLNQVNQLSKGLTALQQQVNKIPTAPPAPPTPPVSPNQKEMLDYMETLDKAANKLVSTLKFLAGGFLSLQAVRFVKDLADAAARAEVLSTVLHVVANNAGISTAEIDKTDKAVQRLGITAQSSRQSLTQMIQAGLDLKFAPQLARASQDLAVISGKDSSETFQRLITNIQQLDTLGLRWMGIIVDRKQAEIEYAKTVDKTADALNKREQTLALTQATLKKAAELEGTYEASMFDVGKMLSSLTRLTIDASTAWGNFLLPTYRVLVEELSLLFVNLTAVGKEFSSDKDRAEAVAASVQKFAEAVRKAIEAVAEYYNWIVKIGEAYLSWKAASWVVGWLADTATNLNKYVIAADAATAATTRWGLALKGLQFVGALYAIALVVTGLEKLVDATQEEVEVIEKAKKEGKDPQQALEALYKYRREHAGERVKDLFLLEPFKKPEEEKSALPSPATKGEALVPQLPAGAAQNLVEERRKIVRLNQELLDAKRALRLSRGSDDEEQAKAAEKKASDAVKHENETFDNMLEAESTLSPKRKAANDAFIKNKKELKDLNDLSTDVSEAEQELFGTRVGFTEQGKPYSVDFSKKFAAFETLRASLDQIAKAPRDAAGNLTENFKAFEEAHGHVVQKMREGLQLMAPAVKEAVDLERLTKAITEFKARATAPDDRAFADQMLALGRLKRQRAEEAEGADLRGERKRQLQDASEADVQSARQHLELTRQINTAEEQLDKDSYDRGLLGVEEYNQGVLDRDKKAGDDQIALQETIIAQKNTLLKTATSTDIGGVLNQIFEAENRLEIIRKENENRQQELGLQGDTRRRQLARQVLDLNLQTAASYGSQSAIIEQINQKYVKLQEQLKAVAAARGGEVPKETTAALEQAQIEEILKAQAKFSEEQYKTDQSHEDSVRTQIGLQRQQLDVASTTMETQRKAGAITDVVAQREQNTIIRERIALANSEQASLQRTLDLQRERLRTAPEERRKQLEAAVAQGLQISPEDIQREVDALTKNISSDIESTQGKIISLNGTIIQLGSSMKSYNQELTDSFINTFSTGLTTALTDFQNFGKGMENMAQSISNQVVGIFIKAFTERLFKRLGLFNFVDALMNRVFGGGGGFAGGTSIFTSNQTGPAFVEGGPVSGPGTGTSDSIIARVSTGEHIMPASKAAQFMPLLEGIRLGTILPYALGGMVGLQSLAIPPVIPRRYANGGVVVSDGGASAVQTGNSGPGNMIVSLHPDALNMTMREWLEHEVIRQQGRR